MTAIIRLKRELQKCVENKNYRIETDNILEWNIFLNPHTSKFNKEYHIVFTFKEDYPFSAPKINFKTSIIHPNIDRKGDICLGIISEWKSKYTVATILDSIISILNEPNLSNPVNIEAAMNWK